MSPVLDAERRVNRGRKIVAQQQELVARLKKPWPAALELLKAYKRTLALFEETLAMYRLRYREVAKNAGVEGNAITSMSECEEARAIARLLEILRGAGYHCELTQETLH